MLVKSVAFALCHSQGFLCDESVASGAEQELALERHAISHSGSCGCVALRQKWILLYVLINVLLIHEKVILLVKALYQFVLSLCRIIRMFLVADNILVVRAFACRRTNRGDNTVGSAVWRLARTTEGNKKLKIFVFKFILLVFLMFIFAHLELNNRHFC
jgi:hypothetical protein